MTTKALRPDNYRPDIDGLRALAVASVVINHFNAVWLPGGYLGVDVFFVISGYVITSSIASRSVDNFGDFIAEFYARRIKRLVPALVFFVVVTSILIAVADPSPTTSLRTGISSLFGLSNIYLLTQSTKYFESATELNAFAHTWSLGVEEQFYLIFPCIFWFTGASNKLIDTKWFALSISIVAIASYAYFLSLFPENQPQAYFLMPSRFWELGAGSLALLVVRGRKSPHAYLKRVPPLLIIAILTGCFFFPVAKEVAATSVAVIFTSLLIVCLTPETVGYKLLSSPYFVYVGKISYSLYLWHWGVLCLSRWTFGVNYATAPVLVILIVGISILSYHFIEVPFRQMQWSAFRARTIGHGLVSLIVSAVIVGALPTLQGLLFPGAGHINLDAVSEGMIPRTTLNRTNCHLLQYSKGQTELDFQPSELQNCHIGDDNKPTLLIVGDSHANHIVPIYSDALSKYFQLRTSTRPGAMFPNITPEIASTDLATFNRKRVDFIVSTLKPGDVVLVVGHLLYNLDSKSPRPGLPVLSQDAVAKYAGFYANDAAAVGISLKERGISMIIFAPIPNFHPSQLPFSFDNCANSNWLQRKIGAICRPSSVDRKEMLERRSLVMEALVSKSNATHGFLVWDAFDRICPESSDVCSSYDPNNGSSYLRPIYRDMDHLSSYGARSLEPNFLELLRKQNLLGD